METIYWIQRLGDIHTMAWVFFWLSLAAILLDILAYISFLDENGDSDDEDDIKLKKIFKRILRTSVCVFVISLLAGIFIPTEKELYVIYGVGGTIDYIKGNETAKQLPDKVINALDAWVDKQTETNNKD